MNKPSQTTPPHELPSPPGPLLEIRDLYKSFWLERRRIDVLQGVYCSIQPGETVAFIGASGAGKSTLLHLLGTLDTPTQGEIFILGKNTLSMTEDELAAFRNATIGFVFQAHYLLPEFSALENVMMPALIHRIARPEAANRAAELLDWVGLGHRKNHRPGELSGGERQRVALCRALVMRPRLLLADEPTGNLDAKTAQGIHELILSLKDNWGVTPIVVTHNQSWAYQMERCFHLVEGRLEERPLHKTESPSDPPKDGTPSDPSPSPDPETAEESQLREESPST